MECPYCGTENEIEIDLSEFEEHDLETLPPSPATQETGMGVEQRSFKCENCGAIQALEPAVIATECAFCGSPAIMETPSNPDLVRPTALVPFALDAASARAKYRQWLGAWWRRLISPGSLKKTAVITKLTGVYTPFYTFDAQAESDWSGWRGDYYYVTVGSGKNARRERRTRWTYGSDHHSRFYDDILVYASRGLPEETLRKAMPYHLSRMVPYKTEFLAGFAAEEYTSDPESLWGSARDTMKSEEWRACRRELGGDTYRNLQVHTVLQDPTWKHILLPLYVASYVHGDRHYHFLVNGQTGEVKGSAPISWAKVGGIVGIAIAAAVGIAALLGVF
ncbi:MAG: primosomal protein N' (replication factor Y) - superfamily II helicase [Thermoplasmata archaeon]